MNPSQVHKVKASSFADPADIAAFKRAKAKGLSDQEAFKVGDNGIGAGGMFTATDTRPICALPPEIWEPKFGTFKKANGAGVAVTYNGHRVIGVLGDTMPHQKNITNGCGIDLNPGFAKALGITPPFTIPVEWEWIT